MVNRSRRLVLGFGSLRFNCRGAGGCSYRKIVSVLIFFYFFGYISVMDIRRENYGFCFRGVGLWVVIFF